MTDEAVDHLRRIRGQIARIDERQWEMETRVSLEELCDALIAILESGGHMDPRTMANRFVTIINRLIRILQIWQGQVITFKNFVGDKYKLAKKVKKSGNNTQMAWTSVNCITNAGGLIAMLIPGPHQPVALALCAGTSLIGIIGRAKSSSNNAKQFQDIDDSIQNHDNYSMISFSKMMQDKQNQFEQCKNRLMTDYGFNDNGAESVAIIEMIIECMLVQRLAGPRPPPGIAAEETMNILSQLFQIAKKGFEKYGKHTFNLMDDTVEVTVGGLKALSGAVVIATLGLNMYQLYSESNDREERVESIENMRDILQDGSDSIHFFVDKLNEFRVRILVSSQNRMESEMDDIRAHLARHQTLMDDINRLLPQLTIGQRTIAETDSPQSLVLND